MINHIINPGDYNKKIKIFKIIKTTDSAGFAGEDIKELVLEAHAKVKTMKGMAIIKNDADFEKAYINFTIRYPKKNITKDMIIEFEKRSYSIEYLNNIDANSIELEIQAKEVSL